MAPPTHEAPPTHVWLLPLMKPLPLTQYGPSHSHSMAPHTHTVQLLPLMQHGPLTCPSHSPPGTRWTKGTVEERNPADRQRNNKDEENKNPEMTEQQVFQYRGTNSIPLLTGEQDGVRYGSVVEWYTLYFQNPIIVVGSG